MIININNLEIGTPKDVLEIENKQDFLDLKSLLKQEFIFCLGWSRTRKYYMIFEDVIYIYEGILENEI